MGERRAVQVSWQLWKQVMTEGYTSGAPLHCPKGIPPDARYVGSFTRPYGDVCDLVLVFESDNWPSPPRDGPKASAPWGEEIPGFDVTMEQGSCQTCQNWTEGATAMEADLCEETGGLAPPGYGCTWYKPRSDE